MMLNRVERVKPPSRKELVTLRLMIILGLVSMFIFLRGILDPHIIVFAPLYWMLIVSITFICIRVAIEWVHYFYITVPVTPPQTKVYTVDILTTFCEGEPYEMILETLTAIQAITYPHQTYLCDEADDPYLKKVCQQLGVHHVTRTHKINAKAGNINNALEQASGEICVILDPDHIPFPEFLDPIISHFDNPKIGFVQIVQAYYNQHKGLVAKGAAQQTFQFYGPIMMTMNKYGTVPSIGANCTFRRSALDDIGGYAAGLAEDMHTAMQMHARGWRSVYVPSVLARGLVPSTLSAYYAQQLKWSRGVFELLLTTYPKLFKKFTWQQKLHYALVPMHYLSGIASLLCFLVPVISLLADRSPASIDLSKFMLLGLPTIMSIILIRHFVQRWVMEDDERGFHVVGGLLSIGTWWIYITGLVYTIIRKKVPYIPTPKDDHEENNWYLSIPHVLVIIVSVTAIIYGIHTDYAPYTLIMAGFALLNCFIALFSIVAGAQFALRRLTKRNKLMNRSMMEIDTVKGYFWQFRHRIYRLVRHASLLITVCTTLAVILYIRTGNQFPSIPDSTIIANGATHLSGINNYSALLAGIPNNSTNPQIAPSALLNNVKGVNYTKGQVWRKAYSPFTKQELAADVAEMKRIGINTIKCYGPDIYDHNIIDEAQQQNLHINYGFWVPDDKNFISHKSQMDAWALTIIATVNKLKDNNSITCWNIGNTTLQKLSLYYDGAVLLAHQKEYLGWLRQLVLTIKQADPKRPVTTDVYADDGVKQVTQILHRAIPQIDSFGLVVDEHATGPSQIASLDVPWFYSKIGVTDYLKYPKGNSGAFISNWQDKETADYATFDGLKDVYGLNKFEFYQLGHTWNALHLPPKLPLVKILTPSAATFADVALTYHAIILYHDKWQLAGKADNLQYRWELVMNDQYNNPIALRELGSGPSITFNIPEHPDQYRLCLYLSRGEQVRQVRSILNTPL